ncbi:hypothetical protein AB0A74_24020 [Saccharothrix sp. NPDC042600]|uniref:hypothetical protein n=1 Tax=Saccharothrix TaxID=2071 RepID=UPI003409A20C|nr:hypothetical protein GCM10017745_85760 [Saccharothrix mutabilis subsp. capreolus]
MFNDDQLRAVDPDVADVLKTALEASNAGAGIIYRNALNPTSRFELLIHVETDAQADYYGQSDVVYTGTGTESYLFGRDKFNVLMAMQGLSLRILLNIGNATTSGQRLSTLVHEVGVHGTRLWAALTAFNKRMQQVKGGQEHASATQADMAEIQRAQLASDAYSAEMHHTEFGEGAAEDYNEFKAAVTAVLKDWAGKPYMVFADLVGANKWEALLGEFTKAAAKGEANHAKMYWHPKVEFAHLLKVSEDVSKGAAEFAQKSKVGQGGLLGFVKSFF